MAVMDRKTAEMLSKWDRFCEREKGFLPPKIASAYLGLTNQAIYAAADRGWLRYYKLGTERFYSKADCYRYREAGNRRKDEAKITPLDRHLARAGIKPHPRPVETVSELAERWFWFLVEHGGAYPPRLAAAYLRITVQSVLLASRKGWIRRFQVGRENFYSAKDVRNYWHSAAARNRERRPRPQYSGEPINSPGID
jgi:hypothetical protein